MREFQATDRRLHEDLRPPRAEACDGRLHQGAAEGRAIGPQEAGVMDLDQAVMLAAADPWHRGMPSFTTTVASQSHEPYLRRYWRLMTCVNTK